MTYTAAKKVTSGKVPGLQLVRVNLWRGFSALTPKDMAVTNFAQLVGKGVLVSGPTSGGKGGGPDLIFQAALKRSGFSLSDFKVCYLPVMEAAPMMAEQKKMNSNPACDSSFDMPPTAISLVEPAATGMVMQTLMPTSAAATVLSSSVDYQSLFSGFTAWPAAQLPHGGLTVLNTVLDDVGRKAQTAQVLAAYDAAVAEIATADTLSKRMEIAQIVSTGITKFYGSMGLTLPAPVIAAALSSQDLVMRGDLGVDAVQADLQRFLNEVVGVTVPVTFYRSGV
jgi:ABC-type nitrate/sulfonate/bicarbonate transport system substrate-binding protein